MYKSLLACLACLLALLPLPAFRHVQLASASYLQVSLESKVGCVSGRQACGATGYRRRGEATNLRLSFSSLLLLQASAISAPLHIITLKNNSNNNNADYRTYTTLPLPTVRWIPTQPTIYPSWSFVPTAIPPTPSFLSMRKVPKTNNNTYLSYLHDNILLASLSFITKTPSNRRLLVTP